MATSKTDDLKSASAATSDGDESTEQSAFMPVVIGVLTAVILLLAAVIFFIVNKTRQRKQQFVQLPAHDQQTLVEKLAMNAATADHYNQLQYQNLHGGNHTATSDTGSSGSKASNGGKGGSNGGRHFFPKVVILI